MRCPRCGYTVLSKIKVWEDRKTKETWWRLGCLQCGHKFNVRLPERRRSASR